MIRKRFFPLRLPRIVVWTTMAVTSASMAIGRAAAQPTQQQDGGVEGVEPPTTLAVATTVLEAIPTTPESGLVVIRHTPQPPAAPTVTRRVVVTQAAPARAATAPTRTRSSGS